ncbi:MAG: sulfatase-like hydrolase/transferase, partial [Solirubrobacterales bacterium]
MSSGRRLLVAACLMLGGLAAAHALRPPADATAAGDRPNVIVILTDDQTLAEMSAMPKTNALLGGAGTTFDRAYVSYPLCCPSRATLLSGQYMHNHNVRGNAPPAGGWERFVGLGEEAKALPVWLH